MTKTTRLKIFAVVLATVSIWQTYQGRAQTCGASQNCLDGGQALHYDQYIISPNGNYRLYFQSDGQTILFDTSGSTWVNITSFHGTYSNASHFLFADPNVAASAGDFNFSWYQFCSGGECNQGTLGTNETADGAMVLRLEDDGCLRAYDQGGTRFRVVWLGACNL